MNKESKTYVSKFIITSNLAVGAMSSLNSINYIILFLSGTNFRFVII